MVTKIVKLAGAQRMPSIRPIRTAAEHRAALARLEALWGAPKGSPERDEFAVLSILIDAYESEHHPIDPPSPIEAIRFRMEQMGWTRKDLEPVIGTRARVSEVMTGKRGLSVEMIRSIRSSMGISADVLVGADPVPARRSTTSKRRDRAVNIKGGSRQPKAAATRRRDSSVA